jgi:energy-coupling factor transporter ATP-binding protein EcfA2
MTTIEIEDIECIEHLSIPIKPGVIVLRGANGSGKSAALEAIDKAMGGGGKVTPRDGARRGSATIGDFRLTATQKTNRSSGELAVESIQSRVDLARIVDPGLKDDEAADRERIKQIIGLMGVVARPSDYYDACGGQTSYAELAVDDDTDDPILLASRVKRALEMRARERERLADKEKGKVESLSVELEGVDLDTPCDKDKLAHESSQLHEQLIRLVDRKQEAAKRLGEAFAAKTKLESIEYDGPTVDKAMEDYASAQDTVGMLRRQLDDAERAEMLAKSALNAAQSHSQLVESCKQIIAEATDHESSTPTPTEIEEAQEKHNTSVKAVADGERVREALVREDELQKRAAHLSELTTEAKRYRRAAGSIDDVLSSLIGTGGVVRVEAGRAVCDTDRKRGEPMAEMSHGQRWTVAIELAAAASPEHGIVVISQEGWEGLDPTHRKLVRDLLLEKNLCAITAESDDGQLRVEEMNE